MKNKQLTAIVAACIIFTLMISCGSEEASKSDATKKAETVLDLKGGGSVHWGYDGHEGPDHWGELSPEYILCAEGTSQSPIDLNKSDIVPGEVSEIEFFYNPCPLELVNNTHAIVANPQGVNYIEVAGKRYDLLQFHFHAPSEHTVNERFYPIETHFVHVSEAGELLVVGVFAKKGERNENYAPIWRNLPSEGNEVTLVAQDVDIEALFPEDRHIYNYSGSLTTPPCSEGVNWNVMVKKVEMSKNQISKFEEIYDHNNRPVQPLNGREVVKRHEND